MYIFFFQVEELFCELNYHDQKIQWISFFLNEWSEPISKWKKILIQPPENEWPKINKK